MSEFYVRQHAVSEYMGFVNGLSSTDAQNTVPGTRILPAPPGHMLSAEDMLRTFLARRPEFGDYEAELRQVFPGRTQFPVDAERWNALGRDRG
jgi:hypothetical protein